MGENIMKRCAAVPAVLLFAALAVAAEQPATKLQFQSGGTVTIHGPGNLEILGTDSLVIEVSPDCRAHLARDANGARLEIHPHGKTICKITLPKLSDLHIDSHKGTVHVRDVDGSHEIHVSRGDAVLELGPKKDYGPARLYVHSGVLDVSKDHCFGRKLLRAWQTPSQYSLSLDVRNGRLGIQWAE